ncbi:PAS domain S-box protein [uncultured Sunxiuqinia sp.]|uniref:PAS domain-containing sensor histidine kinase n=1 Tax=uncultured Sunxiuqinia sp. TaxID=1573825 RepID=UPI002605AF8B|nr:PAS domain S-box protein [uncultured Sunxiuqinia sp.]
MKAEEENQQLRESILIKNGKLFRKLFDDHKAPNLIIDAESGDIIHANRQAINFYAISKLELLSMKIQDFGTKSTAEIESLLDQARQQKFGYFECLQTTGKGIVQKTELYINTIEFEDRLLLHLIINNSKQRKHPYKNVSLSEARLRQAEIASKSGNWELHLDDMSILGSRGAMKIYGVDRDHFNYQTIKEFPLPEYRTELDQALKNLLHQSKPYKVEFKIKAADTGQIKHIHSTATYDREKGIIFGIIQDITDRKKQEEAIQKSEANYRHLLEMAPDAFFQGNSKGDFIIVNDKACELTGYSQKELLQMNMKDLFASSQLNQNPLRYDRLKSGESLKIERELKQKNGNCIAVEMSSRAMDDGTYQSFIRDISQHKQAQQVLQDNEIRLRELNATKDKLFSIIAHDLKSPFNSIIGFSSLLADKVEIQNFTGIGKYVQIIQQSAQNAMDLLLNLLEWSRSQTGRTQYNPEQTDCVSLIEEATLLLSDVAEQKSISLVKDLPLKAPVYADHYMISTILRNLITNAIKFTKPGGQVTISAQQNAKEVTITVADNGIGMEPDALQKLFRLEESFSTPGTVNEMGTGLGLILCKEFVEKHQGKITVESEPGKGSRFQFTIPNPS